MLIAAEVSSWPSTCIRSVLAAGQAVLVQGRRWELPRQAHLTLLPEPNCTGFSVGLAWKGDWLSFIPLGMTMLVQGSFPT